jgi:hypothetical protein
VNQQEIGIAPAPGVSHVITISRPFRSSRFFMAIFLSCKHRHPRLLLKSEQVSLEGRGFVFEDGTVHECGCAVLAWRREVNPIRKAA